MEKQTQFILIIILHVFSKISTWVQAYDREIVVEPLLSSGDHSHGKSTLRSDLIFAKSELKISVEIFVELEEVVAFMRCLRFFLGTVGFLITVDSPLSLLLVTNVADFLIEDRNHLERCAFVSFVS